MESSLINVAKRDFAGMSKLREPTHIALPLRDSPH